MKSVIEEMEELIRKNLPEATATTLKKYLEEAEENKKRLEVNERAFTTADKKLEEQTLRVADGLREIERLKGIVKREEDLKVREQAVITKEIAYDVAHANLKTAEAEKRADAVYRLAEIVFKNPTLVRSTSKTNNLYNNGQNGNNTSSSGSESETVSERLE